MAILTTELLEAMQEHLMGLYRLEDGTLDITGSYEWDDLATLRACVEAIRYMKDGQRFETVALSSDRERTACEVVAYYELEEFVAAA